MHILERKKADDNQWPKHPSQEVIKTITSNSKIVQWRNNRDKSRNQWKRKNELKWLFKPNVEFVKRLIND